MCAMKIKTMQPVRSDESAVKYPHAFVQEKLDGIRGVYIPGKGVFTRSGKPILAAGHIYDELTRKGVLLSLDGEIYAPGLPVGKISGMARGKQPNEALEFHVFDIIDTSARFKDRLRAMGNLAPAGYKHVRFVKTFDASTTPPSVYFEQVISRGGEGIIIRNGESYYEDGYAPCCMVKVKPDYVTEADDTGRWDLTT